nr:uncharacterized protein LOC123772127 isoform X1 [Procambarus clarkii]
MPPRLVLGVGVKHILVYLVHYFLLLVPPLAGMEVTSPLPSPWADPEACGFTYDPTPDLQNNTICDPDHTLDEAMRAIMEETLTQCREKTSSHIPIIVFLADFLMFPDGADDPILSVEDLLDALVTSYNLPAHPNVILLVVVNKPFKILEWQSASLSSILPKEALQNVLEGTMAFHGVHDYFSSTIFHALHPLCEILRREGGTYTTKYIMLTVTWVVFVIVFGLGLVSIAIYFFKVHHSASKNQLHGEDIHNIRGSRGRSSTHPMSGDIRELTTVSYRSTGHVLLGTSDITALAVQNCASTDNLINT